MIKSPIFFGHLVLWAGLLCKKFGPLVLTTHKVKEIFIRIFRVVTVLQLDKWSLTWLGVSTAPWGTAKLSATTPVACAPMLQLFIQEILLQHTCVVRCHCIKAQIIVYRTLSSSTVDRHVNTHFSYGCNRCGSSRPEDIEIDDTERVLPKNQSLAFDQHAKQ